MLSYQFYKLPILYITIESYKFKILLILIKKLKTHIFKNDIVSYD